MLYPRSPFLIVILSICAAAAVAVAADQPPAPQDSKKVVPSTGQEPASKPALAASPKPAPAVPQQATPTSGVVVFIDPATGQIRQPDPSEIGGLVTPTGPAPKAPEPGLIQGPGGAVGARLGSEALTYMVVSTAPDGKLDMDCVTGEKAATARITAAPASAAPVSPAKDHAAGSVRPQGRQHPQDTRPQDTQNVKNPR